MTTYYTVSGNPIVLTRGSSKQIRDEFTLIQTAFANVDTILATQASPTFTGTVVLPAATSIGNVSATELAYLDGVTSAIQTQLNAKAPNAGATLTTATLVSPTLSGTPIAPTATAGTNTTQIATTEFVTTAALTSVVPVTAPDNGKYLTNDGTAASWGSLAAYALVNDQVFTGNPRAPTPSPGDADTSIATTEFVDTSFAKKASPTFTGVPAADTAAAGTNTTQLATTAFVTGAVGGYAAGAIGTYVLAYTTSQNLAFGDTIAGSSITPASAVSGGTLNNGGTPPSGTWRCMGDLNNAQELTLYVRIS